MGFVQTMKGGIRANYEVEGATNKWWGTSKDNDKVLENIQSLLHALTHKKKELQKVGVARPYLSEWPHGLPRLRE